MGDAQGTTQQPKPYHPKMDPIMPMTRHPGIIVGCFRHEAWSFVCKGQSRPQRSLGGEMYVQMQISDLLYTIPFLPTCKRLGLACVVCVIVLVHLHDESIYSSNGRQQLFPTIYKRTMDSKFKLNGNGGFWKGFTIKGTPSAAIGTLSAPRLLP
ncbi:hypothetical protein MUK42_24225 [Musa troglodytarum]|uniref:Uncharacterized protein n=1 Tax=Musa troglodytarum TaxID=320322 RepID=A0A9E7JX89_9LILI|nr:hypothetical protein MUK42_24225 [Musa troglodytarum]